MKNFEPVLFFQANIKNVSGQYLEKLFVKNIKIFLAFYHLFKTTYSLQIKPAWSHLNRI